MLQDVTLCGNGAWFHKFAVGTGNVIFRTSAGMTVCKNQQLQVRY
jgi:hypothetical protein